MTNIPYDVLASRIQQIDPIKRLGKVVKVVGLVIESLGPAVSIGRLCNIENREDGSKVLAEVVGFRDDRILLMPFGPMGGISPGAIVTSTQQQLRVPVGEELIGRILGGLGDPIDSKGPVLTRVTRSVEGKIIPVLQRERITKPVRTGIRAIDSIAPLGSGQRMGIFAGSGVGKSVMLGMIARGSSADVNVIALVGERGREVRDFIERDLGPEGLSRSVVIAVSSDQPALVRIKGAMVANTIAEYFRDQGKTVMLLMDSVTRVAMAQREIGLAVGEPPTTKGYTPSVFAMLPMLLERAGNTAKGSITGMYTVLVEGDDFNEPISDAVRSILDGHVTLSRKLASQNQYPAVDILDSISRLAPEISTEEELELAGELRSLTAAYREAEDLINIGAYVKGSNELIDRAVDRRRPINEFLRQKIKERAVHEKSMGQLAEILGHGKGVGDEEVQVPA